jgi:curli production assembly/transport component CsgG
LLFAGLLLEGAVIAYDANIRTGGGGARYLGIGKSVAYREDVVSISLRLVSTATGESVARSLVSKNYI